MDLDERAGLNSAGAGGGGYAWESEYKRSWDALAQDPTSGSLRMPSAAGANTHKRGKSTAPVHRGLIRHLVVIIDASRAMAQSQDILISSGETTIAGEGGGGVGGGGGGSLAGGNRLDFMLRSLKAWIEDFFDGNPLACLCILGLRDGLAERWTEWHSNPADLLSSLSNVNRLPLGDPSLQNGLDLALQCLLHVPRHTSREILVVYGSLYTCDPGSIFGSIDMAEEAKVRVSVVGLGAQVKICQSIATQSKGTYLVATDARHLIECMGTLVLPPPLTTSASKLITMGFPQSDVFPLPRLCSCHSKPVSSGFSCPVCASVVCQVPRECPICALVLCSAPSLARSYHHLFPHAEFVAAVIPTPTAGQPSLTPSSNIPNTPITCYSCSTPSQSFTAQDFGMCSKCRSLFCFDCEAFIHEYLYTCPGCLECKERAASST